MRLSEIQSELIFIENNRDIVAEFNKDKRELFDKEEDFKNNRSLLEKELGITEGLLGKWRTRYQVVSQGQGGKGLAPSESEAAQREIRRLQRELLEVTEEREILKKVVSIFSRKSA